MHALRLHVRVPARGKAKGTRKLSLQQVTRQRDGRGRILQGLRSFLTADFFMYGPLLESPATVTTHSDGSQPRTPDREQENGGFDVDSSREYEIGEEENDTGSGKVNIDNGHDDESAIIRRYRGSSRSNSKTMVSMLRTSARMAARSLLPPADGRSRTSSSTARVPKPSRNGT